MHNYGRFEIDLTDSLLLTGLGPVLHPLLGMRGMEVRKGSRQQGYFQVRIVRSVPDDYSGSLMAWIGITINDVPPMDLPGIPTRFWLDYKQPTYGWVENGRIYTRDGIINADNSKASRFRTGDVVGLMVDCVEIPTLRFFLNGVLVRQLGLLQEDYGSVLYPAFLLNFAQIHVASNPGLPIEF